MAVLLLAALNLGYSVGPSAYSVVGMAWRYGGLAIVAAVPVWFAVRYRIVTPLATLLLVTGYVLGMELSPPGPTFRDVAELERLDEPTGIMVVENGLYIVRYMVNASVWTVGFLYLGLVEYTIRRDSEWLPDVATSLQWVPTPAARQQAALIATGGGLLHAVVMVWFASRLGVAVSGGFSGLLFAFGAVGMWVLAAIPTYLLVRHKIVLPAILLTGFIFLDVWAEFTASVDDPHALYFGGWFFYLGLLLVAAGIEYGLSRLDVVPQLRA